MEKLIKDLENFEPKDDMEVYVKDLFLNTIKLQPNALDRSGNFHFTASAFVVNKEHTKMVSSYHKIYDSYTWLGGHADGIDNTLEVAMREVEEESGIKNIKLVGDGIFAIQMIPVNAHIRKGKQILPHMHLDCVYVFEADENEPLRIQPDENEDVKWLSFNELMTKSTEPYMIPIYRKLIDRLGGQERENAKIKVVTISGSMKFKKEQMKIAEKLELENGYAVIQSIYNLEDKKYDYNDEKMLDKLHCKKIDISDAVFVVNIDGYIGESTKKEIEYAISHGKEIIYLEPIK